MKLKIENNKTLIEDAICAIILAALIWAALNLF